ncbi:MAG: oligosaccharide flippase family protein [Planctomycetota bacterium]|jgi:O-antigen/teichoic acid export membrane protein
MAFGAVEANAKGKNMHQRSSLIVNAFSNWVVLVVNVIIGLLLTPYIISHIDKDGYGIWTLAVSFVGYYGLLQLGIGAAILRYLPFHEGRGNQKAMIGAFSTAVAFYLMLSSVILCVTMLAAGPVSEFFKQGAEFTQLFRLVGLSVAIGCPVWVLDATIRSCEKFVPANAVTLITSLFRAVALAVVLRQGRGLVAMGWVMVALGLLSLSLNIITLLLTCRNIRFSLKAISADHLRTLISFGIMMTLMSFGFMLRFQVDRVVIGRFMGMEALGIYAVAATLLMHFRNSVGAAARVLFPRFGYLDGKGRFDESVSLFLKSTKLVSVIACGIAGALIAIGPSFVKLWVGPGFEASYAVLLVLALAQMVDQSQTSSIALLAGHGKQGVLAVFAVAEGTAATVLAVLLVPKYGVIGVAAGLAIPMVIAQAIVRPLYVCRFISVGFVEYYRKCLLRSWILAAAFFMPLRMLIEDSIGGWIPLILVATAVALVYLFIAYFFVFDTEERRSISKRCYTAVPIARYVIKEPC